MASRSTTVLVQVVVDLRNEIDAVQRERDRLRRQVEMLRKEVEAAQQCNADLRRQLAAIPTLDRRTRR